MPNNWKTYKFEELYLEPSRNGVSKPKSVRGIGFKMVNMGEIFKYSFISNQVMDRVQLTDVEYNKSMLAEGDLLFARQSLVASGVGKCILVNELNEETTFESHLIRVRLKNAIAYPKFIYYKFQSQNIRNIVISLSNGVAAHGIKGSDLQNIELELPPIQEQKSIASILSAIDDKIENNLAINKTLEEMAMALYKHWFVDFGPFQDGEFVDSELGKIPKGWEVKRLDEFVNLTMGQSPKSEFYNLNNEGLPFHQGVTNYGERFPEDKTYSTEGNRFAEEGDILFSVRAPVGRLNIAKNKIILGRGLSSMTLKNHDNNGFLFYSLKNFFTEDDKIGDGTVYGSVNKTELENLKFIIPCKEVIDNFNDLVKDIDSKYLNNYKENQTLTQLRDTLLPKLISGEVRLKEFREAITN